MDALFNDRVATHIWKFMMVILIIVAILMVIEIATGLRLSYAVYLWILFWSSVIHLGIGILKSWKGEKT